MRAPSTRRFFAAGTAMTLVLALVAVAPAATSPSEWKFVVRLDGKPIGTHSFVLAGGGDGALALRSEADFNVRVLGVPLYRYRHRADERWSGGCLTSIEAQTSQNGRLTEILGQVQDERFDVQVRADGRPMPARSAPAGCLMSFAYWNPALGGQTHLLDPGSGRIESVLMDASASAPADLDSSGRAVRGLRIGGLSQPIDVWYIADRWVGLDTLVSGRRLSYRLR
jgi:hypothetical protein